MNNRSKKDKIELFDWLLLVGACLAPMTGFRFWKIGPGELLCMIWCFKYLFTKKYYKNDIIKFFSLFIFFMLIGAIFGYAFAPNEIRISDFFTWIYLGVVSTGIYVGLSKKPYEYIEMLFKYFARMVIIWNVFLFLYSIFVSRVFFGAPLWFSNSRFTGGGTNPHQVALLLCGCIFVFIRYIILRQSIIKNVIYIALGFILIYETASSTGILAIAIGLVWTSYLLILHLFSSHRNIASILFALFLAIVGGASFSKIYTLFMGWVSKDANGLGRISIFLSFPETFVKSPLFGLGPGVHGLNGYIEYHNTYLEVLAATGIMGGILFLLFSIKLFKKVFLADWKLTSIIVVLYGYGLAGFAMRRLAYWVFVIFVVVISEKIINTQREKNLSHTLILEE